MSRHDPSFLRRVCPAIALTGVGLGLVHVLDRPVPAVGAFGSTEGAVVNNAAGSPVTSIAPALPGGDGDDDGDDDASAQGSGSATPVVTAPPVTRAPSAAQAPAPKNTTGSNQQGGTQSNNRSANDCGAITRTGAQTAIALRRTYGTMVVTADFTSAGQLCAASAIYDVTENKSRRYNDYAVPILNQEAAAAGSANIQGVSGATATSNAYVQSLQSAIDQL